MEHFKFEKKFQLGHQNELGHSLSLPKKRNMSITEYPKNHHLKKIFRVSGTIRNGPCFGNDKEWPFRRKRQFSKVKKMVQSGNTEGLFKMIGPYDTLYFISCPRTIRWRDTKYVYHGIS